MANLVIQNLPDALYTWLNEQAKANQRTVQQEVLALLETQHRYTAHLTSAPSVEEIMEMAQHFSKLPEIQHPKNSEAPKYDAFGLPC